MVMHGIIISRYMHWRPAPAVLPLYALEFVKLPTGAQTLASFSFWARSILMLHGFCSASLFSAQWVTVQYLTQQYAEKPVD